jgi:acetyl-CoA carboxylase carboxyltransferase component
MMEKKLRHLQERRRLVLSGGGEKRIEEQHQRGKRTARERINMLLDEGSFVELGTFVQGDLDDAASLDIKNPGEGVVAGCGAIDGRRVYLFAQDFTVAGGSLSEMHARKICRVLDLAGQNGAPVIGLNDSGGARIQEGVSALNGYGEIFYRNMLYSGVIPQISIIMGSCAGGAACSPALTDFVFMVDEKSHMFITGPQMIEAVTGENITMEELGGAAAHNSTSGVAHFLASGEEEGLKQVRTLLSYLPSNNLDDPPAASPQESLLDGEELMGIIPDDNDKSYDIREIIRRVVDGSVFFEVHEQYARNAVAGFARLSGTAVGIVANQPLVKAGCLDIDASDKISRFVRFCDSFNLPLITFVDVPGYLPGVEQEWGGIIRHGAKILYAYAEATVPKISVVLRKAYGGAYIAMGSRSLGSDLCLAWPGAEIAVMGPEAAVKIINRRELESSAEPEKLLRELAQGYRERFANPYIAAARGWIDEVIDPRQTREYLCRAISIVGLKRVQRPPRKHGNIPL